MQTKTIGFLLIIIGIVMMVYTGFNYVTTEKVVDLGPIQIDKKKNNSVEWPPVVGILLIVGGIFVIARNRKSGN